MYMRKLVILIFLILCIGTGIFLGTHKSSPPIAAEPKTALRTSPNQISPLPVTPLQSAPGIPTRLIIPKINVSTTIEIVGQDQQGRMDVPKDPQNVGWYDLGFKPGEKGSAVIDGHLDTATGAPAAFWFLSKLQQGDTVTIVDEKNHHYRFTVTTTVTYDYDKVPLQKIFASTDAIRLNLITCRGIFDKKTKNYSKRIVVYTVMR